MASAGTLSNPELADMPAAALMVYLFNDGRGSDFADAALVLAARERRLAEAEARIRAAEELAAARERERERSGAGVAPEEAAQIRQATETDDEQLRAKIRAESEEGEIGADDLVLVSAAQDQTETASEAVLFDAAAGVQEGTPAAEVSDEEVPAPRLPASPLRIGAVVTLKKKRIGAVPTLALPPILALAAPTLQAETINETSSAVEVERVVIHSPVLRSHGDEAHPEGVPRRHEQQASPGAGLVFTESQGWQMLNYLKSQVAAWELELGAADDDADNVGTPQQATAATPPPHPHEVVIMAVGEEAKQEERSSEATSRLRDDEKIVECERRLAEAKAAICAAAVTEERLRADIAERKARADEMEERLRAEIAVYRAMASESVPIDCLRADITEGKARAHKTKKRIPGIYAEINKYKAKAKARESETEQRHSAEIARYKARASETEEHLHTEITKYKARASESEQRHRAEIARYKARASEAEQRHRAEMTRRMARASETEQRHCAEINGYKIRGSEAEQRHRAEITKCMARASESEQRHRAEITEYKIKASEAEQRHRAEIARYKARASDTEQHLHTEITEYMTRTSETEERLIDEVIACRTREAEAKERFKAEMAEHKARASESEKQLQAEIARQEARVNKAKEHLRDEMLESQARVNHTEERFLAKMQECEDKANETKQRLQAEIMEFQARATDAEERLRRAKMVAAMESKQEQEAAAIETEAGYWAQLLASGGVETTYLEAWRQQQRAGLEVEGGQAQQVPDADDSMIDEAHQLREEIRLGKRKASETDVETLRVAAGMLKAKLARVSDDAREANNEVEGAGSRQRRRGLRRLSTTGGTQLRASPTLTTTPPAAQI